MSKYIYLSGPMTGIKDFNRPFFNEAADFIQNHLKWDVWNPAEHDGPEIDAYLNQRKLPPDLWESTLNKDLEVIRENCWAIAMLPGWTESPGARAELDEALRCGLKCYHIRHLGYMRYDVEAPRVFNTTLRTSEDSK